MSERERWIVYPLLLFALGAALRDRLIQRIDSKEIRCESLQIIDHQDPARVLAELKFDRSAVDDPTQLANRVGVLRLHTSEGREVCKLDQSLSLAVGSLTTGRLKIVDPNFNPLIVAQGELQPAMGALLGESSAVSYQGVLYLNNQRVGLRLAAPSQPAAAPSVTTQPPSTEDVEPAEVDPPEDPAS